MSRPTGLVAVDPAVPVSGVFTGAAGVWGVEGAFAGELFDFAPATRTTPTSVPATMTAAMTGPLCMGKLFREGLVRVHRGEGLMVRASRHPDLRVHRGRARAVPRRAHRLELGPFVERGIP